MTERLERQVAFIVEIDKLKNVLRQTLLTDESRQENSAEHSWHLALMAGVLAEYAPEGVDIPRVVRMVLVHDLVEIDAGDAFCYDPAAVMGKAEREQACADRIFDLLPPDQGAELRALWDEFEERSTPDGRFANALDRLQPLFQNFHTRGGTWRMHGVQREQVMKRMDPIRDSVPALWPLVEQVLERATAEGWIK